MTDPRSEPRLPFFVYGTLRPGEPNHDRFLRGRVTTEEPGLLADALLYEGPGYPYAVESAGAGPVHGELITARPEHYLALLAELDRLEDYAPGDPSNLYERVTRTITRTTGGVPVVAWVYVAAAAEAVRLRACGTVIASGDWLSRPGARHR